MLGWGASVSPKDNWNDAVSRRHDSYVRRRGEFGEVKIVGSGRGPKLGNFGIEGDQITDFHGAEDGR